MKKTDSAQQLEIKRLTDELAAIRLHGNALIQGMENDGLELSRATAYWFAMLKPMLAWDRAKILEGEL